MPRGLHPLPTSASLPSTMFFLLELLGAPPEVRLTVTHQIEETTPPSNAQIPHRRVGQGLGTQWLHAPLAGAIQSRHQMREVVEVAMQVLGRQLLRLLRQGGGPRIGSNGVAPAHKVAETLVLVHMLYGCAHKRRGVVIRFRGPVTRLPNIFPCGPAACRKHGAELSSVGRRSKVRSSVSAAQRKLLIVSMRRCNSKWRLQKLRSSRFFTEPSNVQALSNASRTAVDVHSNTQVYPATLSCEALIVRQSEGSWN